MSDEDKLKNDDANEKTDWNEEHDAWLELIEAHLKSIQRGQLIMIILLALLVVITALIYFP